MRTRISVFLLISLTAVLAWAPAATAASRSDPAARAAGASSSAPQGFYFGRIAFENSVIGIAVDGSGRARVMATDAQPGGVAEWFEAATGGGRIDARSASRKARLRLSLNRKLKHWTGTMRFPSGRTRRVAVNLAGAGAGLYDVTVSRDGRYTGRSTDGKRLTARRDGRFVAGTIRGHNGGRLSFRVMDLARAFGYRVPNGRPGRYTVIVSRNGTLHYGRSGAVKRGKPGANLIALDINPSSRPTPGFYFGKVAFERDVVGVKVDTPAADGRRRVRIYVSDSEPEPRGDVEWFTGNVPGSSASLTSASGKAKVVFTFTDDLVSGTITFADGRRRRFFALPAGDGAGIYVVTVSAGGQIVGASEEGSTLTARQEGAVVRTTITTPAGRRFTNHPTDLTRALAYSVKGNKPDTYLAIVAPRGRFIFGRSGDVRGGTAGLNIIGIDKAC